jgi:hypothetical protein
MLRWHHMSGIAEQRRALHLKAMHWAISCTLAALFPLLKATLL